MNDSKESSESARVLRSDWESQIVEFLVNRAYEVSSFKSGLNQQAIKSYSDW